jgi:pimeloyl-ACP methyl ester carboxylesterase
MPLRSLRLVAVLSSLASTALADEPAGWKFKAGQKGKPAILLIHGLAASRMHWTNPGATWSIKNGHYLTDWKPKPQSGTSMVPAVKGFPRSFKLSKENKKAFENGSFWKRLTDEGFTVATWNQLPCADSTDQPSTECLNGDTFDKAYPTAKEALAYLASKTDEDIVLIAHSRGGLLGRKLLKESDAELPALKRVKLFITLHTPHKGSSVATSGNAFQEKLKDPASAIDLDFVPKDLRKKAKDLLPEVGKKLSSALGYAAVLAGLSGAKELDANGPLIKGLEAGEKKRPGVRYVTFGGNSPRTVRLFARVYTDGGLKWKTEPRTVLDLPLDLKSPFPELKEGGDLLVTDASSHFALEDQHFTYDLNHAQVLWSKRVKNKVVALINSTPPLPDDAEDGDDDDTEPDDAVSQDK